MLGSISKKNKYKPAYESIEIVRLNKENTAIVLTIYKEETMVMMIRNIKRQKSIFAAGS
jgi:hypothetical protein